MACNETAWIASVTESCRPPAEKVDTPFEDAVAQSPRAAPQTADRQTNLAEFVMPSPTNRDNNSMSQRATGSSAGHDVLTDEELEILSSAFDAALAELLRQGRVDDHEVARKRLTKIVLTVFRGGERNVETLAAEAVSRLAPAPEQAGASSDQA